MGWENPTIDILSEGHLEWLEVVLLAPAFADPQTCLCTCMHMRTCTCAYMRAHMHVYMCARAFVVVNMRTGGQLDKWAGRCADGQAGMQMSVRVCRRVCVRACDRAFMHAFVRAGRRVSQ